MKVLTNPLRTENIVLRHESFLDQPVRTTSDVQFNSLLLNDIRVCGDATFTGSITQIETENLTIKDNIITINAENNFPILQAGFQIYRGPGHETYDIIYDETSMLLKAGFSSLHYAVALCEDNPIPNGFAIWDDTQHRFITKTELPGSITFIESVNVEEFLQTDLIKGTNVRIQSIGDITLDAVGDIVIPKTHRIRFGDNAAMLNTDSLNQLHANLGSVYLTQGDSFVWNNCRIFGTNESELHINGPEIHLNATNLIQFDSQAPLQHSSTSFIPYSNLYSIVSLNRIFIKSVNDDVVFSSIGVGNETQNALTICIDKTSMQPSIIGDVVSVLGNWEWAQNKYISLGPAKLSNIDTDLVISSTDGISFQSAHIDFPQNCNINIGSAILTETSSSNELIIQSSGDILLNPLQNVMIDTGKQMTFGKINNLYSPSDNSFVIHAQNSLLLDSPVIEVNSKLQFGTGHLIYNSDGNDLVIQSSHSIILDCPDGFQFGDTLSFGACTLTSDSNSSLVLNSANQIIVNQDLLVLSTTNASTVPGGSIISMGGIYVNKNLYVAGGISTPSTFSLANNVVVMSDTSVPLTIQNSSYSNGTALRFNARWDALQNYTIGRGTSLINDGRSMTFTIPEYATYVTGTKPAFVWGSSPQSSTTISKTLMTLDENALTTNVINVNQSANLTNVQVNGQLVCMNTLQISNSMISENDIGLQASTSIVISAPSCSFYNTSSLVWNYDNTFSTFHSDTVFEKSLIVEGSSALFQGTATFDDIVMMKNGLSMNTTRITNLAIPLDNYDAVNKMYVDSIASGMSVKMAVTCSTTNPIDLTQPVKNVIIDNVELTELSRVLVQYQDNPIENGIYIVSANGLLVRANDMSIGSDVTGASVFVSSGTLYGSVGFVVIGNSVIIGKDEVHFTPFSGAASLIAGTGLAKTGNTLMAVVDDTTMEITANNKITINPTFLSGIGLQLNNNNLQTSYDQSHVTKLGTITSGVWQADTIEVSKGGTGNNYFSPNSIIVGEGIAPITAYNDFVYTTSGLFGIGTSNPLSQIHVVGTSGTRITIEDSGSGNTGIRFKNTVYMNDMYIDGDGFIIMDSPVGMKILANNNTNILTITDNFCESHVNLVAPEVNASSVTVSDGINWKNGSLSSTNSTTTLITTDILKLTGSLNVVSESILLGDITLNRTTLNNGMDVNLWSSLDHITNVGVKMAFTTDVDPSFYIHSQGITSPKILTIGPNDNTAFTFETNITDKHLVISTSYGLADNPMIVIKPPIQTNNLFISSSTTTSYLQLHGEGNSYFIEGPPNDTTQLTIGDVITRLSNIDGSNSIVYDPSDTEVYNGGTFNISKDIGTLINGDLVVANTLYTQAGKCVTSTFINMGWYYLGKLETGRIIIETTSWIWNISLDGLCTTYNSQLLIYDRSVCVGVIYKNTATSEFHLFVKVLKVPVRFSIIESTYALSVESYEGNAVIPNAVFSGFNATSWILDLSTDTAQATQSLEVGQLVVEQKSQLREVTLKGTSTFEGMTVFQQPCTFNSQLSINTDSLLLCELTNQLQMYSNSDSPASIILNASSACATFTLDDITKNLVIDSSSSDINIMTSGNTRCYIDNSGIVTFSSSIDEQNRLSQGIGSFIVNGSALFNNSIRVLGDILIDPTSCIRMGSTVMVQPDNNANQIWFNNARLSGVDNPVEDTDVVTKKYVEGVIQGITTKQAVIVATTEPIDLSQPSPIVMDGVTLQDHDRILVKNQTNSIENGLYEVIFGEPLIRTYDFSLGYNCAGTYVFVNQGLQNSNAGFICSSVSGSDIVGVNAITFNQFSGAGQIQTSSGIGKNGNTIFVNYSTSDFNLSSQGGKLQINSSILGLGLSGGSGSQIFVKSIEHLDRVGTLKYGTWNANTIDMEYGGTGASGFTPGRVVFSNGFKLTQGQLYFDNTNQRLGINTLTPTSGLTMSDRDIELYQSSIQPPQLLYSSSMNNYSFSTYNDGNGLLVFASGVGTQKTNLSRIMELNATSLSMTNGKMKANVFELPTTQIMDNAIVSTTTGPYNLSVFSNDNSGSTLSFYGAIGTIANTLHSEYMKIGYDGGSFVIETVGTGIGVQQDLSLQHGNMILKADGTSLFTKSVNIDEDLTVNGTLTVGSNVNFSGALLNANSVHLSGDITAQNLNLANQLLTSDMNEMKITPGHLVLVDETPFLKFNDSGFYVGYSSSSSEFVMEATADNINNSMIFSCVNGQKQIELSPDLGVSFIGNVNVAGNILLMNSNSIISSGSTLINGNSIRCDTAQFKSANISSTLWISDLSTIHRRALTYNNGALLIDGDLNINNKFIVNTSTSTALVSTIQGIEITAGISSLLTATESKINLKKSTRISSDLIVSGNISSQSTISADSINVASSLNVMNTQISSTGISTVSSWDIIDTCSNNTIAQWDMSDHTFYWNGDHFNIITGDIVIGNQFITISPQDKLIDCTQSRITGISTPLIGADAVNKAYVDNIVKGLNLKAAVDVATTDDIDLTGPVLYVDTIQIQVGMRILVMNQTNTTENGIYEVQSSSMLLTRAPDFAFKSHVAGAFTFVQQGFINAEKGYVCISDYPDDVVGENVILFTQFNGNIISAGAGLYKDGNNVMNIGIANNSMLTLVGNKLSIDSESIGSGLNLTNGKLSLDSITSVDTVTSGRWSASIIDVAYGGTGTNTFQDDAVVFAKSSQLTSTENLIYRDGILQVIGMGLTSIENYADVVNIESGDICLQGDYSSLAFASSNGAYNWTLKRRDASSTRSVDQVPSLPWTSIYSSRFGTISVMISDPILTPNNESTFYLSSDGGFTWTEKFIPNSDNFINTWEEIAFSGDGHYIVACSPQNSLYISQDYGVNFQLKLTDFDRVWEWCSISNETGQYMLASSLSDGVFLSSDYGTSWTAVPDLPTDVNDIGYVRVTRTGDVMIAGYFPGNVLRSIDYGQTWTPITSLRSNGYWYDAFEAMTSNVMVTFEYPGSLWISNDRGLTWTEKLGDQQRNWIDMSVSANGLVIGAVVENGLAYISMDGGNTFVNAVDSSTPRPWTFVQVTQDASAVFIGGKNIPVYMANNPNLETFKIISNGNVNVNDATLGFDGEGLMYPIVNGNLEIYISKVSSNLVIGSGNTDDKSLLTDFITITEYGQMGVGYPNTLSGDITYTVDVLGSLRVSGEILFKHPLSIESGGTGSNSFKSGIIVSDGKSLTSIDSSANGSILIGSGNGTMIVESGSSLRSHIGLAIGTDVQGYSAVLTNLSNTSFTGGKKLIYYDTNSKSFNSTSIEQNNDTDIKITGNVNIQGGMLSCSANTSSPSLIFSNLENISTVLQRRCRVISLNGESTLYATIECIPSTAGVTCSFDMNAPNKVNSLFTTSIDGTFYTTINGNNNIVITCETTIDSNEIKISFVPTDTSTLIMFLIFEYTE